MANLHHATNEKDFQTVFEDLDPFAQDVYHWMMSDLNSSEVAELYSNWRAVDYNIEEIKALLPEALRLKFKGAAECMCNLRSAAAWALSCYSIPNYSPERYADIVNQRGKGVMLHDAL